MFFISPYSSSCSSSWNLHKPLLIFCLVLASIPPFSACFPLPHLLRSISVSGPFFLLHYYLVFLLFLLRRTLSADKSDNAFSRPSRVLFCLCSGWPIELSITSHPGCSRLSNHLRLPQHPLSHETPRQTRSCNKHKKAYRRTDRNV